MIRQSVCAVVLVFVGCAAGFADDISWRVTAKDVEQKGLALLEGGDGVSECTTAGHARCVTNKKGTTPPSAYLYFNIEDALVPGLAGPVYVVVEYFDGAPFGGVSLQYDSANGDASEAKYWASDDQWGGLLTGRKKWRTCVFLLEKPLFANRENLGGDFRIEGSSLFIRSVVLARTRPDNLDQLDALPASDLKQQVKIGAGGQLIIGGFDPARKEDVRRQTRALLDAVPALKSLGVTSHEGYVRWNLCEPEPGVYDWSVYDAFADIYKQHGLKWVPFLIVGSPYSLPDWYYKKPGSQGYVCLEHGEQSDVQSLWNPVLREHVARFIKAFCEHYRDTGVIESILLGVTGNYGEAIYPVTGNDWTADIHGTYHTHPGFWAGDPFAVESFRAWLRGKYESADKLNAAWGTSIADIGAVEPFRAPTADRGSEAVRNAAPNDRAWLDFCDWYIGSMTDWAGFWLSETRKNFPKGDIYLCTGGHAPAEHGSNFGDQCKAAAAVGGGVRITNEGSDYRANFSLTRWVASAGEQYGAYYSFEPAGPVDEHGVVARIYGATASGARGLHYYYGNIYGSADARANFVRWGRDFTQRTPKVEIAVYYPQTYIKLNGNKFLDQVQPLRDYFDFNYASDEQILDGGLDQTKVLILLQGNTSEAKVWHAITEWVKDGGLLVYPTGMGKLRTVEGDESIHETLLAPKAPLGRGRVMVYEGESNSETYRAFLAHKLAIAPELSPASRKMVAADGEKDNVYVTLCGRIPTRSHHASNELLWLNYTPKGIRKGSHTLPPYSIVSQKIRTR